MDTPPTADRFVGIDVSKGRVAALAEAELPVAIVTYARCANSPAPSDGSRKPMRSTLA